MKCRTAPAGFQKYSICSKAKVNVEYMYAFIERHADNAVIIFRFDENDKAVTVLQKAGITILGSQEIYNR